MPGEPNPATFYQAARANVSSFAFIYVLAFLRGLQCTHRTLPRLTGSLRTDSPRILQPASILFRSHQKHSRGLYSTIHLPTSSRTVPSANRVLVVEPPGTAPGSVNLSLRFYEYFTFCPLIVFLVYRLSVVIF